jgi:hypothetical protein
MRKLDWLENGNIEKLATAFRKLAGAEQNSQGCRVGFPRQVLRCCTHRSRR